MRVGSEKLRDSHKTDDMIEFMAWLIYNQEFCSYPRIFKCFLIVRRLEGMLPRSIGV